VWDIEAFQKQPEVKDRIDAQSIGDISFSQAATSPEPLAT
jgi:hypothetical protein